nr:hypothetical protein [uncultured Pedobacter sp.]
MEYIEQQDVTLDIIIKSGLLKENTTVYAGSDTSITGTLNLDGSITLLIGGIEKTYPYPSGAARAIRNISVSGWVFWKVLENGEFVELLTFKRRFQASNLK